MGNAGGRRGGGRQKVGEIAAEGNCLAGDIVECIVHRKIDETETRNYV